ncbi:SRPBCC family protein [Streptomyces sp. NPDC088747]|uniref:aromatic ring-hydroxylating oxygenase subunit alpha n=1 Tax=Streptomyces sp. NPDC088747 TaxID=3365886 RepID=UPI00380F29C9
MASTAAPRENAVPFEITDPKRVPAQRYYSRAFHESEKEKLWSRVWQVAARLEEIPRVGDFTEYTINDQSLLIVREADGNEGVKAYFNACRHRATALGTGTGTFHGKQIVCPYHGWRWNLDGSNSYVYAERGFTPACLDKDFLRLREAKTGVWGHMVFVNLDPECESFEDFIGSIAKILEPIGFDRMRVRWWKHVILPGNWKMAQEAFLEAYHVMQAHPSLSMGAADEDYDLDLQGGPFECLPQGHSHATPAPVSEGGESPVKGMSMADYFIQFNNALYFGTDSYTTEREMFVQQGLLEKDIPQEEFIPAFFKALYEYAQGAGIDLPAPATETTGYGHIFPNLTFLPAYGNSIIYRTRPYEDDPEKCVFEVWAVQIPTADAGDPERPELEGPVPVEEWPQIFKEDYRNIIAQQRGIHTEGFDEMVMSEPYEAMIINSHAVIDTYLRRP